ncbi:GNAT family N-acetyltransferase, partial [Acinetobacter baumannii]
WVYYVAVDPDQREKGYGRTIMTAAENWLRDRGVEKLQLLVRADNTRVQAFYETLDYDQQERVIYAKWLDGRPMTP